MLEKLEQGEYDGYIWFAAKILFPKLPQPQTLMTITDLRQDFRICALEAIDSYDPNRGAKFTTHLYKHLQIRSFQFMNYSWLVMNHPKGKGVQRFSWYDTNKDSGEAAFDPTGVEDRKDLMMQLKELKEHLTPRNAQLLDYFIDVVKFEEALEPPTTRVLDAFCGNFYKRKISELTGLDPDEVESFFMEVAQKARKYVEV